MPELPEVETVCRGIAPLVIGATIEHVALYRADLRTPFPVNFATLLQGRQVMAVTRRAKYILIHLDDGGVWLVHLGMSGRVLLGESAQTPRDKHDHVEVMFSNGEKLRYQDPRRFGVMTHLHALELHEHPMLAHLGPEPLGDSFDATTLQHALKHKKVAIKLAIMQQEVVVGVGNIYASESLFRAGIHPQTPACEVALDALTRLVTAIKEVLVAAIQSGGSTLRDYVRSDGGLGYFQHEFAVYGRDGAPCVRCGSMIERITQGGRSTFYCPQCQPKS